jgi:hypothetical protein
MNLKLMRTLFAGSLFTFLVGLGLAIVPSENLAADDTKAPAKDVPAKAPDFSKYVYVKDVTGEIVKADDKKITLKVTLTGLKPSGNPKVPPTVVEMHHEYDFTMLPESLVRNLVLPPKIDANGKKVPYTDKEKEALKVPPKVVGYAASVSDLTKGTMVNVILVREKSIPESKAKDEDLRVKYAVIQPAVPKQN